jgi:tetratricopeptide (TPR) repeat protein
VVIGLGPVVLVGGHQGIGGAQPPVRDAPFAQGPRAVGLRGEHYGLLAPTDPIAQRVSRVFEKIVRVAGRRPGTILEIHVLDTPRLIAEALPGGSVVVARGMVDLLGATDDGLAFHHGLLLGASGGGAQPTLPPPALELEADRLGLLYAMLAGYRARSAVRALERIVAMVGSSPLHPDPRSRAAGLRVSIRDIGAQLELFPLGLVYSALGDYEEAVGVYRTFESAFPSREVYNNLGVSYHRWALLSKPDEGWRRSIMADARSRARATIKGAAGETIPPHLQAAISAYRFAVDADPDYAVGHSNLGLAYLDAGQPEFAIGHLKLALAADGTLKTAWNNRGVAYAVAGDLNRAQTDFLRASDLDPAYPDPHANLARLYELQGRRELATVERELYERLRRGGRPSGGDPPPESLAGYRVGGDPGELLRPAPGVVTLTVAMGVAQPPLQVAVEDAGALVAVLRRGRIELLGTMEGFPGRTAAGVAIGAHTTAVQSAYGSPARIEPGIGGDLWIYPRHGLAVLIVGGVVRAWYLTPRGQG